MFLRSYEEVMVTDDSELSLLGKVEFVTVVAVYPFRIAALDDLVFLLSAFNS